MRYELLIPEFVLGAVAMVVVALELAFPRLRKDVVAYVTALGLAAALAASLAYPLTDTEGDFAGLVRVDDYTTFFRVLFTGVALVVALGSAHFVPRFLRNHGEYYGLLAISVIGATYMAAGVELLTAYLSLELLSFTLYILVSFAKRDLKSNEGGMKYMLLGAFSSAVFLYGLSLVYGITGTTEYAGIGSFLSGATEDYDLALLLGLVLVVAGLGFKVAAAPFHVWTPDAYEGAPLPVTAYLTATSKAAGFAMILRLFTEAFSPAGVVDDWRWMLAGLAAATMVLGNLIALQQHNFKRLMAYSSIGQVGFMLMGVAAFSPDASSALLLHLAGYVVTSLAVFLAAIAYYNVTGKDEIADFAGAAERAPFLALTITVGLFSLAGMPLFAGFATKFILFQAAAQQDLLWLAGLAVVGSLVSLYYYLQVIKVMYLGKAETEGRLPVPAMMTGVLTLLVLGILFIGIYPTPVIRITDQAAQVLF